jgi:DNA polymerase III delta prime subunit
MNYLIVTTDPVSAEQEALEYAKSYNPSDVFWVKKNADKKEITVDVINEMINQFNLAAVSDKKLFIVFQAELMNTSAQNKLLKTIEEANDNTTVMFTCQNLDRILPTVRSRCIIKYHHTKENKTLQQLAQANPDTPAIQQAAHQFFTATTIDVAMSCLPVLSKPENLTLALDALNKELATAEFSADKKFAIYQALAKISRNIAANCNSTNTFDLLLLARF